MGQEFHVLRCFSCQVFQVQQVKKSKRWVCKVCGEKQSLVKEFGRGGAADCRKHVQKLNALRGRLQEVTLGSQPDPDDESEAVDGEMMDGEMMDGEMMDGEMMDNSEQEASHPVSRWSKYTDPADEEDEEEEQNIYTEPQRSRSHGSRKRRKISDVKSSAGAPDVCEDEESPTGMKRPYLPVQCRFRTAGNKASASRSTNLPSAPQEELNNRRDEKRGRLAWLGGSSGSRWEKFLAQPDEDEYDQAFSQGDHNTGPYFTEAAAGVCCEESSGVVDGGFSSISDTRTSRPTGSDPPCLKLSFNPMFLTDEDFDDTL